MAFQLNIQNVLISDNLDNCCHEILTKNGINVKAETKLSKEQLLAEIPVSIMYNVCKGFLFTTFLNAFLFVMCAEVNNVQKNIIYWK